MLRIVKNIINLSFQSLSLERTGIVLHIMRTRISIIAGLKRKTCWFMLVLGSHCLAKNLIASAKGWAIPLIATTLGPNRNCLSPRILRSNKVTIATEIKIGKISISKLQTISSDVSQIVIRVIIGL